MDDLEQDQVDAKALFEGDALFAPITVLKQDRGDIEADVLHQLATLNEKAGKAGLVCIVLEPVEVPVEADTPNPDIRVRLTVQVIEEQMINDSDSGTQISVFTAARRVRQLLHRRSFGGGVWSWVETVPAPQDSAARRSRLVTFERRDYEERTSKCGVTIDPENGGATPIEVTITPSAGATARYTLDGTYPGPAATAYTVPLNLAVACTLRVVAYKSGSEPSDVAQAAFT